MADAEMATSAMGGGMQDAIIFGVAATMVYDVFSATNSSPQTTELFASDRAETLWKYVRLGGVQSAVLIGIMTFRGRSVWPVLGGASAGAMMWAMYAHALKSGGGSKPAFRLPWSNRGQG